MPVWLLWTAILVFDLQLHPSIVASIHCIPCTSIHCIPWTMNMQYYVVVYQHLVSTTPWAYMNTFVISPCFSLLPRLLTLLTSPKLICGSRSTFGVVCSRLSRSWIEHAGKLLLQAKQVLNSTSWEVTQSFLNTHQRACFPAKSFSFLCPVQITDTPTGSPRNWPVPFCLCLFMEFIFILIHI